MLRGWCEGSPSASSLRASPIGRGKRSFCRRGGKCRFSSSSSSSSWACAWPFLDPGLSALENRGLAIAHRPNCLELRELLERARDRVHDLTEEADRAHAIDWPSVLDLRDLPQAAPSVQAGAEGLRGCDAGMILNPGHTSLPGLHRRAEGAETPDRQVDFTHGILEGQFQQPGVGSIACATAGIGYAPLYENMKMFAIPSG